MLVDGRLAPSIDILKADNVVFAQIVTALHFNQHQPHHTRVFQAVVVSARDVRGLIGGQHHFLIAIDDLCGATHDHPVFRAVVVHLQTETATRFDFHTLDFEAVAFFEHGVGAPKGDARCGAIYEFRCRILSAFQTAF